MKPSKYIEPDNDSIATISQIRNDGQLNYNLVLKIDINKYLDGNNLIDCLILTELNPSTAFDPITEDLFYGDNLFTGYT